MKKIVLAIASLAMSSVLSPCVAGTAIVKFNVSLDSFCDVFHLKEAGTAVYGTRGGCDARNTNDGGTVATVSGVPYIISSDRDAHNKTQFVWYFTPPSNGAGNWQLYVSDGKSYVKTGSGTYSKLTAGGAALKPGEKSAVYGRNQ